MQSYMQLCKHLAVDWSLFLLFNTTALWQTLNLSAISHQAVSAIATTVTAHRRMCLMCMVLKAAMLGLFHHAGCAWHCLPSGWPAGCAWHCLMDQLCFD